VDFGVTVLLGTLNFFYVGLAIAGLRRGLRCGLRRATGPSAGGTARTAVVLLAVFVLMRTVFFASLVETPEPRYVLECFPAMLALGALAWLPREDAATKPL
jgi:4-amino-4-deoxy-L-arabinose transferase-like glycosyltransferase